MVRREDLLQSFLENVGGYRFMEPLSLIIRLKADQSKIMRRYQLNFSIIIQLTAKALRLFGRINI